MPCVRLAPSQSAVRFKLLPGRRMVAVGVYAIVALMGIVCCGQDGYQVRRDWCFYKPATVNLYIKNMQRSGMCTSRTSNYPTCSLKIRKGAYFLPIMCDMHIGKSEYAYCSYLMCLLHITCTIEECAQLKALCEGCRAIGILYGVIRCSSIS